MSEHHHGPSGPDHLHHHAAEHASHGAGHHAQHADGHPHEGTASRVPTTRDPYPFIYSKDLLDRRRFAPLGDAPTGRTSRGETIFAVVVIVAVLGIGLITVAMALFGGR